MSIKKLFDSANKNRSYLSDTDQKTAFKDVESNKNVQQVAVKQNNFIPQIDFSDPENFAKYGSAYLYYKGAIERIYDYYPYDGSDAEINKFYNDLLSVEKFIFNDRYPRTTGYGLLSADGWGTLNGSIAGGYGLPNTLEYITFFGGPNSSSYSSLASAFSNPKDSKYQHSNIYDTDIYKTDGQPSDYGSGTRQSNLKSNFDTGVTVEFWLKKDGFSTSLTEKEVVFDMWNNNASGTVDYGRMRIELTGAAAGSPFLITALSGTSGIYQQSIGADLTTASLTSFGHYAFSFYNDGTDFVTKLYVNGTLNDTNTTTLTLSELYSKNMVGRLGALLTASASPTGPISQEYAGKLSASIDEFRFWKIKRDSKQIADKYKTQVRGGTNNDISNTTLGVYFKFNEGITTDDDIDSTVLDYSGRISNGTWTGYGSNSRHTGSAIVLASAATSEYLDPIIYSSHPSVSSLNSELLTKGKNYDLQNNNAFVNLAPSWLIEDAEDTTSDMRLVSHIVGAYLDRLYLEIDSLTKFKNRNYTSASYTPLPFAKHMPQSLGLYVPDIFIDSTITENVLNQTADGDMESTLAETKNLIYLNLYNNIANIFKAKGTEKSVRNIFRCFNIDDKAIKLKTYFNNQILEISNNLKLQLELNTSVNGNHINNLAGVVYQKSDSTNSDSAGFISGSYESSKEELYGFTTEANIIFPDFRTEYATFGREFTDISLFGVNEPNTSSADDTTWLTTDNANFQVFAVRDAPNSKNVYFKITSSISPHPIPELTSSVFLDVYDNEEWNISVRMKPTNYPLATLVTGSDTYTYKLEFQGLNTVGDTIQNSFMLTSSISKAVGSEFLKSAKRLYAGARRTNLTGTLLQKNDVLTTNIKYWTKYLDDLSISQHTYDTNNAGISGSYRKLSPIDSNFEQTDALNLNTLALHWTFANITGSDSSGNFYYVTDESSGSAELRNNYSWIGAVGGYQHTGYGYGYATSSTDPIVTDLHNTLRFTDPENPASSNMINIFNDSDLLYQLTENSPDYYHIIEKSMYNAISEEMLSFFAGVVDFNNVIGEPVHRYRQEYKSLNKLREIFFRKVTKVSSVEKFIDYYKWLDDSLSQIVSQMLPAADNIVDDAYNVVESHILERNKYRTQFPTIEFESADPETPILGINEKLLNWRLNSAPITYLQREHSPWWLERAERTETAISSGDSTVDQQRETIRKTANIANSQSAPNLSDANKTDYYGSIDVLRRHSKPYRLEWTRNNSIQGGVNFTDTKNIHYTYNSLYPAGPVHTPGGLFIPQNVLVAFTGDATDLKDTVDETVPNEKIKRRFKVNQGRDYYDGSEYTNVKSSYAFPFNIISGTVRTGYSKHVIEKVNLNVQITNLHNDGYGHTMEIPMQGPFTNYAVGGHQSRHVKLNKGTDGYTNRPEAWKLLLGSDQAVGGITGAIGMVGADYPWPEANEVGAIPYPMTASQKAVFYRDYIAKRPVNIRNIHHTTGSTVLGNYNNNYDIVQTFGGFSNPRGFVDNTPTLPAQVTQTPAASQGRTILSIRRGEESHFEFTPDYSVSYLTSAVGKSVIRTKFSNPGGIEVMGHGYGDIRSDEYSVYNALNYRNLTILRPFQNMSSSTVSETVGAGTPGIRVSDIHGNDFGLRTHLARHAGRFGRDSVLVTNPGATINESPALNKINRNPLHSQRITGETDVYTTTGPYLSNTKSLNYTGSTHSTVVFTGSANLDNSVLNLFNAVSSSGFTYSGWLWFPDDSTGRNFFHLGRQNSANNKAMIELRKGYDGSAAAHEINLYMATQDASTGGSETVGHFKTVVADAAIENTWVHFVLTWTGSQGSLSTAVPTFYIDGASSSCTTVTPPADYYQDAWKSAFSFKGFSGVELTGKQFMVFGGNHQNTQRPMSGSMDEVSLWTRPLTAVEVSGLYNSNVPCDVTASDAYTNDSGSLWDWIRFGDVSGDAIDESNPGVLSSDNIIKGYNYNSTAAAYMPIGTSGSAIEINFNTDDPTPLAGCTQTSILSGVETNYGSRKIYDNFFVQHAIPRSDRQYAWVTGALSPKALSLADLRYWGYAPVTGPKAGYYSSSATGWTGYFDFVSSSSVLGKIGTASIYQPALGLNIYVSDPIDSNASTNNILGRGLDVNNYKYINSTLLSVYAIEDDLNLRPDVFNLLMTKRKNTFGHRGVPQTGPAIHPIIRRQRSKNVLSYYSDNTLKKTTLSPVSYRGIPTIMNIDSNGQNITLKVSDNNEKIYFRDSDLNEEILSPERLNKQTMFEQTVDLANGSENYELNWVIYGETLFPSSINEFKTGSNQRTGYENAFWKDSQDERISLFENAVRKNSFLRAVSQSSWPLDAPNDFLTRTEVPTLSIFGTSNNELIHSNSAGELQNTYLHALPAIPQSASNQNKIANSAAGALYSRKHMLSCPPSLQTPAGMPIPEAGMGNLNHKAFEDAVDLYAGEAVWQAGAQAGIIRKSGSVTTFESHPSQPWFNDYTSYISDVKRINRDFAIVPEFRISEHVSDYAKYGINSQTDTFEIVGTVNNSSASSFYKDFSNSEFMESFADISSKTGLEAAEIKLTCSGTIRFNPYKGFYPAQRTIQMVRQFKETYGESMAVFTPNKSIADVKDAAVRPIVQSFFAPGILYNTIKSGIAVDWPIVTSPQKFTKEYYGSINSMSSGVQWMTTAVTGSASFDYYQGGEFWDMRVPFEAIIKPESYISNINFYDMEPHPSASLQTTASFIPTDVDDIYTKMASNFFGEVGNFFLKDNAYTKLSSNTVTSDLRFDEGSIYGARFKIRRSMSGIRKYTSDSGSTGNNKPFATYGGKYYDPSNQKFDGLGGFPLPQDPKQINSGSYQESFTMYSRASAFGPAVAGRPYQAIAATADPQKVNPMDSLRGYNWSFTPPYYNGEAWLDIIFTPGTGSYDLERILAECQTKYWRADPGISASVAPGASSTSYAGTQIIPTFSGNVAGVGDLIYEGKNINHNAMQLNSSLNLFGVERVPHETIDSFGNKISNENETAGKRWVIQPKMETPMANFSNLGIHGITNISGNLSMPTYASGAVPRGMWHQFGIIEPTPSKGIFLEIGEIPTNWLKFHYDVRNNSSIYNRNDVSTYGSTAYSDIKPLTDIIKFDEENSSKKLGELKDGITIKEAIVAVPYTHEVPETNVSISLSSENKYFFGIDKDKISAAMSDSIGSATGDSLDIAGESIRDLVSKMQNYILPPQFDFINNSTIDPMVMYFFEFEYTLDKDDLNYIWQNLAPRNYKKITNQASSTAHTLGDNQLLSKEDAINENTRWMVFKVKQRSQKQYEELIVSQAGQSDTSLFSNSSNGQTSYNVEFNWPYDYVSFVETIKFGAEVLYKPSAEGVDSSALIQASENIGSKFTSGVTSGPTKTKDTGLNTTTSTATKTKDMGLTANTSTATKTKDMGLNTTTSKDITKMR